MANPITLLLLDDHAVVRSGIRLLLESQPDIEVVGETGAGGEAVELAKRLHPRVVLMDISMPDMNVHMDRHGAKIMEKLNLHKTADLVKYAIRNGLTKL